MLIRIALAIALILVTFTAAARGNYQSPEDFLQDAFGDQVPAPQVVWLNGDLKPQVERILGHRYPRLRIRYWRSGDRSAWILDEVGKDLPITTGVVIRDGAIERLKVLTFRESRGWEVRYPFFTDQFKNARLTGNRRLDRTIDNISGATLSVRALVKQARLALLLHEHTGNHNGAP